VEGTVEPTTTTRHKRKFRNYLLDVRLQLRYTMTIVLVAVLVTAGLGYKMYEASRDLSKVILMTGLVDPSSASELQQQFSNSDRWVLWGILGFGVVLVISITAVGILITHRVAGPLFKVASHVNRVRENRLAAIPQSLRKGDELQEFYAAFREMHQALREREQSDIRLLAEATDALEGNGQAVEPRLRRTVEALRRLKKEKEDALDRT
jgi:hypothetical protein